MIAEAGHFALVIALGLALLQALLPLYGAAVRDGALMAFGSRAAVGQLLFIAFAFAALTACFVLSDFSVSLVAQHSHSDKPLMYKIAGVWGNHEGSMLLWVVILALFGGAVAAFGRNLPATLKARVLAVQGMIGAGFLAFILFTSNPFLRLDPAPLDGNGLNPLLQDPGLATHPPFLYLGYVGFSMAFSFAIAALIEGKVDPAWARWVRPWTLAAWCFLTIGIMLGSLWAYYELGWGGWWFWDPVENASLMPWLAGTALVHSAIVVEKRDALKRWTILLAILTFSLSLIGTFLVRSGVISSVHAFATDPTRGVFILGLLVLTTGGALTLYAVRAPSLKLGNLFAPVSREASLILNNVLLMAITSVVFLGTFYPLFVSTTSSDQISVGPPYYNMFFVPVMLVLMIAMTIGPFLSWKRGDLAAALFRLKAAFVAALGVAAAVTWLTAGKGSFAAAAVGIVVWVFVGSLLSLALRTGLGQVALATVWTRARGLPRATYGMAVAHMGIAVTALGIIGVSAWTEESVNMLKPGEAANVGGYEVRLMAVADAQGPNYTTKIGTFEVRQGGALLDTMIAERRQYPNPGSETTEAGLRVRPADVLYVTLGQPQPGGAWTVRLYHHPLVVWIWLGAVIMALGGGLSLSDRRLRVGAPRRAAAAATAAA
ncbi:MAG: heme lyase CcmF/NrfE family subunit [Alphaproteobacteria bacterium]|nr:heme lyase CcmF/NrfE family subunit [Alphaproteobacteria bacterium]